MSERWGSATEHQRTIKRVFGLTRRRCRCGCEGRVTHVGQANGIALMSGCELSVRRWVRDGHSPTAQQSEKGEKDERDDVAGAELP